jgi:hypothetical protein
MLPCHPGPVKLLSSRRGLPASRSGIGPVRDNEESLARTNETELAAGQFFDGRAVVPKAVCLKRELSIFPLEACERVSQVKIFAPGAGSLDESPLAGNRVGQEDGGCQAKQDSRQAAPDWRPFVTVSNFLRTAPSGGAKG